MDIGEKDLKSFQNGALVGFYAKTLKSLLSAFTKDQDCPEANRQCAIYKVAQDASLNPDQK